MQSLPQHRTQLDAGGPSSTILTCVDLPSTEQLAGFDLHLVGCSLAPSSGVLELLFAMDASDATPAATTFHMQRSLSRDELPVIHASGCFCSQIEVGQHVLTAHCQCKLKNVRALIVTAQTILATDVVSFQLTTVATHLTRRVACTGRLIHGDFNERDRLLRQAQTLWLAVGFGTSIVFAQRTAECVELSRIPGVVCERRGVINAAAAARTAYLYEQPMLHSVCLAHARVANAEFLALADTDDFAPADLPLVLDAINRHRRIAGVRLFFDAEQTCTPHFCPANESDWHARCRGLDASSPQKRNHWKPIVIPNRTRDVAVHQFWPMVPYVRKQVWRVCYSHRHPPPSALQVQAARYEHHDDDSLLVRR